MQRHHINYTKESLNSFRIPNIHELHEAITNIDGLAFGDVFVMRDGKFLGYYVNNLTDFDNHFPKEACETIVSDPEPMLVICQRHVSALENMPTPAYSERTAILSDGSMIKQVLVKAFGEPAWINLSTTQVVMLKDNYKLLLTGKSLYQAITKH